MIQQYDTLYKRTKTGAIQTWFLEREGDKYRTVSGQLQGKLVTSGWSQCQPKNVGKANETTAEEQAIKEIEAEYVKQLDHKYFKNINDIDEETYFAPMLAKDWEGTLSKRHAFTQPKLDGMRAIYSVGKLTSRNGKPIVSVPHIIETLRSTFDIPDNIILDGELYNHALREDFNTLMSLAKKTKPTAEDIDKARILEYHVYDMYDKNDPSMTFINRAKCVGKLLTKEYDTCIKVVDTAICDSVDGIEKQYDECMEYEYEGLIIRYNAPYENKRSKNLLKYKKLKDAEFTIVKICEGNGNRAGMAGNVICKLPQGGITSASISGTHEYCIQLLKEAHEYVGGQATIQYQNMTPDGAPRFPVVKALYKGKRDE